MALPLVGKKKKKNDIPSGNVVFSPVFTACRVLASFLLWTLYVFDGGDSEKVVSEGGANAWRHKRPVLKIERKDGFFKGAFNNSPCATFKDLSSRLFVRAVPPSLGTPHATPPPQTSPYYFGVMSGCQALLEQRDDPELSDLKAKCLFWIQTSQSMVAEIYFFFPILPLRPPAPHLLHC